MREDSKRARKKEEVGYFCLCQCVSVYFFYSLFYYGWKQLPFDWKNACEPFAHPAASACWCSGIVTATIITTMPSTANAATIAIMAIDAFLSCSLDEWFICNKLR